MLTAGEKPTIERLALRVRLYGMKLLLKGLEVSAAAFS